MPRYKEPGQLNWLKYHIFSDISLSMSKIMYSLHLACSIAIEVVKFKTANLLTYVQFWASNGFAAPSFNHRFLAILMSKLTVLFGLSAFFHRFIHRHFYSISCVSLLCLFFHHFHNLFHGFFYVCDSLCFFLFRSTWSAVVNEPPVFFQPFHDSSFDNRRTFLALETNRAS